MILKRRRKAEAATDAPAPSRKRRARAKDPLDVQLTVRFNFGADADDHVTVLDGRSVPMVGSVIANRDRILRGFVRLLLKTAMRQPRVVRELFPSLPLRPRRKPDSKNSP